MATWPKLIDPDYNTDEPTASDNLPYVGGQTGGVDSSDSEDAPNAARAPLSRGQNLQSLREQIEQFVASQGNSQNALQMLANQYGHKLDAGKNELNLSPLMQLADTWYGSNTAKNYKAPLTEEERIAEKLKGQEAVQKAGQPVAQELLREYASDNSAESKLYNQRRHQEAQADRDIKDFRDKLFLSRGTAPEVRQPLKTLQRAGSAIALMNSDALQNGITHGELASISSALAGMVGQGNIVTDERLKEFLPANLKDKAGSWVQWLLSNPYGTDQKAFMDRFRNEINAEVRMSRKTIKGYHDATARSFAGRMSPDLHKQLYNSANEWIDNSFYNPDAVKEERTATTPPVDPSKPPVSGAVLGQKGGKWVWKMPDGTFQEPNKGK